MLDSVYTKPGWIKHNYSFMKAKYCVNSRPQVINVLQTATRATLISPRLLLLFTDLLSLFLHPSSFTYCYYLLGRYHFQMLITMVMAYSTSKTHL